MARNRAVMVLPGGAEQGVVMRSESFRRLGSPETILAGRRLDRRKTQEENKEESEKDKRQKRR